MTIYVRMLVQQPIAAELVLTIYNVAMGLALLDMLLDICMFI